MYWILLKRWLRDMTPVGRKPQSRRGRVESRVRRHGQRDLY